MPARPCPPASGRSGSRRQAPPPPRPPPPTARKSASPPADRTAQLPAAPPPRIPAAGKREGCSSGCRSCAGDRFVRVPTAGPVLAAEEVELVGVRQAAAFAGVDYVGGHVAHCVAAAAVGGVV